MTHNTEVEEVVEYIGDLLQTGEYRKAVTTLHHQLQKAREGARAEYKQFVLNILDGIDIADGQCNTKAIRLALQSRIIHSELDHLPDRPLNYERE